MEENNQLVLSDEMSDADFLANLNNATGNSAGSNRPMTITYNAVNKVFSRETIERDQDGKPIWEELGEELLFHIILSKNQWVANNQVTDERIYSNEHDDFRPFELFDADGATLFIGDANKLKLNTELYNKLKFRKVLYVFAEIGGEEPTPYRMILKGSALGAVFNYTKLFIGSNMALVKTTAGPGKRMVGSDKEKPRLATEADISEYDNQLKAGRKPTANLYYELLFDEVEDKIDRGLIVERTNSVNEYLSARQQATDSRKDDANIVQAEVVESMGGSKEEVKVIEGDTALEKAMGGNDDNKTLDEKISDIKEVPEFDS